MIRFFCCAVYLLRLSCLDEGRGLLRSELAETLLKQAAEPYSSLIQRLYEQVPIWFAYFEYI